MAYNFNEIWGIDGKIKVFFSEKKEGSMRVFLSGKQNDNRQRFCQKIDIDYSRLVGCFLSHGNNVVAVGEKDAGKIFDKTDSLITNLPNLFLTVTAADCLPVFFYDQLGSVVGLAHAGWKGLSLDILQKTVLAMKNNFNSSADNILVLIGPGIGSCHYEVDLSRVGWFKKYPDAIFLVGNKYMLDLKKIAVAKLAEVGIRDKHIIIHSDCTYCHSGKYFSFRRDQPSDIQAHCALIGITK